MKYNKRYRIYYVSLAQTITKKDNTRKDYVEVDANVECPEKREYMMQDLTCETCLDYEGADKTGLLCKG